MKRAREAKSLTPTRTLWNIPLAQIFRPRCAVNAVPHVMNEAPGGSVARRTAPMLSHSTFSGSAHLGGPSTRGPSSITSGSGGSSGRAGPTKLCSDRRPSSEKWLKNCVSVTWVNKPLSNVLLKHRFLYNEDQNQLKQPFVMIKSRLIAIIESLFRTEADINLYNRKNLFPSARTGLWGPFIESHYPCCCWTFSKLQLSMQS